MIKDVKGLVKEVTEKIRKETDVAVLAMSGGADSTLCAILCKLALGEQNVYSVHMPYNKLDRETFNSNSHNVAEKLGLKVMDVPIKSIADHINEAVGMAIMQEEGFSTEISTVNLGNARSRARMTVLYGISHHLNEKLQLNCRVIGTGNYSEDVLGYDSKGGDSLCDFFPIGSLFKSEVYQLLEYFRDQGLIDEENINRTPSAGLWDGQSDFEELGYTYDELEPASRRLINKNVKEVKEMLTQKITNIEQFVFEMHLANRHKHEAPPVIDLRKFCQ